LSDLLGTVMAMKRAWTVAEVAKLLGLSAREAKDVVAQTFSEPRDVLSLQDLTRLSATWGAPAQGQQSLDLQMRASASGDAERWFKSATRLEDVDPSAALDTYAQAVSANPRHGDAHINLGRLLHQAGKLKEAEQHYGAALSAQPYNATAAFNLAVVLEDLGRWDEAIVRYRQVLELDPHLVDAYFNLSRLYEKKGEKVAAIRHLSDYRRLTSPR
jgi:tetratricopeptide (TPR) repeat protein